jgi:predicted protein tyrosine phosphatase
MNILFVCTHNIGRSRTAELLFAEHQKIEARSAGILPSEDGRPLSEDLLKWADLILVMEETHRNFIRQNHPSAIDKVLVIGIPDIFRRGDPLLEKILSHSVKKLLDEHKVPQSVAPHLARAA